jgi:hypothetical protein
MRESVSLCCVAGMHACNKEHTSSVVPFTCMHDSYSCMLLMQDAVRLCMQPGDADVLTFAPVVTLRATSRSASPRGSIVPVGAAKPTGTVQFAVLGLSNMLNSGGSPTHLRRSSESDEGVLLVLTAHKVASVVAVLDVSVCGCVAPFRGGEGVHSMRFC